MVEAGGIEPPSESDPPLALHAYRIVGSRPWQHDAQGAPRNQPVKSSRAPTGGSDQRSRDHDPTPRARAQAVSGLGLKRPERRRRRWRLSFCRWINEESCPLGMRQKTSLPPSKPVAPRFAVRFRQPSICGRDPAGARAGRGRLQLRLCERSARCLSRCQSRSFSVSRLSCDCLPRARPSSTLARLFFQYIASGTTV